MCLNKLNPADEPVNRSSYLTGFCQLLRSQWRRERCKVKTITKRGWENRMGEMKRKRGKKRDDRDGSR